MRNACKNLTKVDEFLSEIQTRKEKQKEFYKGPKIKGSDMIISEPRLNAAITDLRDALNMLSN